MGTCHLPAVSKAPHLPFDCLIMSVCLLTLLAGEVNLEAGALQCSLLKGICNFEEYGLWSVVLFAKVSHVVDTCFFKGRPVFY